MIDRLELFTDEEIRAAGNITLRTPDYGWSQQVTGHRTSPHPPEAKRRPPVVAVIELHEFDAAIERIRRLRPDLPGDFKFEP